MISFHSLLIRGKSALTPPLQAASLTFQTSTCLGGAASSPISDYSGPPTSPLQRTSLTKIFVYTYSTAYQLVLSKMAKSRIPDSLSIPAWIVPVNCPWYIGKAFSDMVGAKRSWSIKSSVLSTSATGSRASRASDYLEIQMERMKLQDEEIQIAIKGLRELWLAGRLPSRVYPGIERHHRQESEAFPR